eukprot:c8534_g1_i1.p1 GENE.c8534_g1_i1~~c8534_g1_i1.p1  ORF type:complete len:420 (+),score=129.36 c8534_g1_i1:57-1316(+)
MIKPFQVSVVPLDLDRQQALHQAFDSLQLLENAFQDFLTRIDKKVEEEKVRIDRINERALVIQAKCQKLMFLSKKATRVIAKSIHPNHRNKSNDYICLYSDKESFSLPVVEREVFPYLHELYRIRKKDPIDSFFVQIEHSKGDGVGNEKHGDGLGRLPKYLPSITSVLLFNTGKNPYQSYATLDNLIGKEAKEKIEEKVGLAEPPKSLTSDNDRIISRGVENIKYKPQMGSVPEFNLPSNLNLPNLAQVEFSVNFVGIAPSLPAVPTITEKVFVVQQKVSSTINEIPQQPIIDITQPIKQDTPVVISQSIQLPTKITPPPPPPLPQPPLISTNIPSSFDEVQKMKKKEEQIIKQKQNKIQNNNSNDLDLVSQLRQSLLRRNMAMQARSNNNVKNESDSEGFIETLSDSESESFEHVKSI